MRTYYVTIWQDNCISSCYIDLFGSEKANVKTFNKKLRLKEWETIIAWSLLEE